MTARTIKQFLAHCPGRRNYVTAPRTFSGSLDELFTNFIRPNLIAPDVMSRAHETLIAYANSFDPLFLVRAVSGQTRGEILTNAAGRFRPTDNSPAWLMHFVLFNGLSLPSATMLEPLLAEWPCHMFDVPRLKIRPLNDAGWHIAHLQDVKDRNSNFSTWSRAELKRRFLRNVHPCNYVPLPHVNWQRYGSDVRVVRFAADQYRELYADIWTEFAHEAQLQVAPSRDSDGAMLYDLADVPPRSMPRPALIHSVAHGYPARGHAVQRDTSDIQGQRHRGAIRGAGV